MQNKILIVEDDTCVAYMVQDFLKADGFDVLHIHNHFKNVPDQVTNYKPNIILLDVNLDENTSGFELAGQIRALGHKTPIIFTTARTAYQDLEQGYKIGGIDYVKKPYTIRELMLRIKELLLRAEKFKIMTNESDVFGASVFFPEDQKMVINNIKEVSLRKSENAIMKLFFGNKDKLVSKEMIVQAIWEDRLKNIDTKEKDNSINNLIYGLRLKLTPDSGIEIITINKCGYKLALVKSKSEQR